VCVLLSNTMSDKMTDSGKYGLVPIENRLRDGLVLSIVLFVATWAPLYFNPELNIAGLHWLIVALPVYCLIILLTMFRFVYGGVE
jgi:hypothetical protein